MFPFRAEAAVIFQVFPPAVLAVKLKIYECKASTLSLSSFPFPRPLKATTRNFSPESSFETRRGIPVMELGGLTTSQIIKRRKELRREDLIGSLVDLFQDFVKLSGFKSNLSGPCQKFRLTVDHTCSVQSLKGILSTDTCSETF